MAERFIGVQLVRDFNWAYTCEHCGKKVEIKSRIVGGRYGTTVKKKELSGTQYTLTEQGKQEYLAQAKADFPKVCENTLSQWNSGIYPDFIIANHDVCTHCKKHQHWSKEIAELSPKDTKGIGGYIFVGVISGLVVAPVLAIILGIITKIMGFRFVALLGILFIAWVPFCALVMKKHMTKLTKEKTDLENKPEQFPQFVSWGDISADIFSRA